MHAQSLSCVWLFATSWTVAHQAPLSVEFFRQEHWSRLPLHSPRDLPSRGIQPATLKSPALVGSFFITAPPGKPYVYGDDCRRSVAQSCLTLCEPMDRSMPGFPGHHQLPELAQTHVHRVGDAIQPSHPLSSPSPPAFNLSQF